MLKRVSAEIMREKTKPQAASKKLDALFFLFKYTIPTCLRSLGSTVSVYRIKHWINGPDPPASSNKRGYPICLLHLRDTRISRRLLRYSVTNRNIWLYPRRIAWFHAAYIVTGIYLIRF